jgi:hypothetical protein
MSSAIGGPGVQPASDPLSEATAALATADDVATPASKDQQATASKPVLRASPWMLPRNVLQVPGGATPSEESEAVRWVRRALAVAVPIVLSAIPAADVEDRFPRLKVQQFAQFALVPAKGWQSVDRPETRAHGCGRNRHGGREPAIQVGIRARRRVVHRSSSVRDGYSHA